mmetsp:Transcript_1069/g.1373  ORF Transcript_1069/g.1373 Transcript_1069/m.1373 type:complete len:511 (+) Transcript_1069:180-1712(+)
MSKGITVNPEEFVRLDELLGEGAYGQVYRGIRISDDEEVAVKIIPIDGNDSGLKREIDFMLGCKSPYVVQLYECYFTQHEAWLVMEYCGGGSSSDIIDGCQVTFSEDEACEAVAWTLLGLQYLHTNKRLHRDIKAGNILLTSEGRAKIADFGVSKEVSTIQNKAMSVIGTPYWMAPEVIQEMPYDGRADVWSLGITLIELVEGNPPLHKIHPMRAIFMIPNKTPPKLKETDKWSPNFLDFISRTLVRDPNERATSSELLGHPWVRKNVQTIEHSHGKIGSPSLRALVKKNCFQLEKFRRNNSEAKQTETNREVDPKATYKAGGNGSNPFAGETKRLSPHFGRNNDPDSPTSFNSSGSLYRFKEKIRTMERYGGYDSQGSKGSNASLKFYKDSDNESEGSFVRYHHDDKSWKREDASSLSSEGSVIITKSPHLNRLHQKKENMNSSLLAAAKYFEHSVAGISPKKMHSKERIEEKLEKLDLNYKREAEELRRDYEAARKKLEDELASVESK